MLPLLANVKAHLAAAQGLVTSLNKDVIHLLKLNEGEFKVV